MIVECNGRFYDVSQLRFFSTADHSIWRIYVTPDGDGAIVLSVSTRLGLSVYQPSAHELRQIAHRFGLNELQHIAERVSYRSETFPVAG